MVDNQIVARGITDKNVIAAMRRIPRHLFVPKEEREQAYSDGPLPIGHSQTISQPYIVAIMTELLGIDSTSKVLEIGTGSGYQAAVLGEIADSVYTIEIVKPLAERAAQILDSLGYKNIFVRAGDGYQGWPEAAPFDAVIVTAAAPKIPQPLIEQLKTGGRLVIPVGELSQELYLVTKNEEGIVKQSIIPVRFVPMTGEVQKR
ncbi:MAG: protein-L-isoaspartate(D-aspartate) O-methyltransferase [bacterium]